jgi:hypothetical protein
MAERPVFPRPISVENRTPVPKFIAWYDGLPGIYPQVNLIGFTKPERELLNGLNLKRISELDSFLSSEVIGVKLSMVNQLRDRLENFKRTIGEKEPDSKLVRRSRSRKAAVIRVKEWFQEIGISWGGILKDERMILAEQRIGDLGEFLNKNYVRLGLSETAVAQRASNEASKVTRHHISNWLDAYDIPKRQVPPKLVLLHGRKEASPA